MSSYTIGLFYYSCNYMYSYYLAFLVAEREMWSLRSKVINQLCVLDSAKYSDKVRGILRYIHKECVLSNWWGMSLQGIYYCVECQSLQQSLSSAVTVRHSAG